MIQSEPSFLAFPLDIIWSLLHQSIQSAKCQDRESEHHHLYTDFTRHTARTAKCDRCLKKNKLIIYRCEGCSQHICTPCVEKAGGDLSQRMNEGYTAQQDVSALDANRRKAINHESDEEEEEEVVLGARDTEVQELEDIAVEDSISRMHTVGASEQRHLVTQRDEESNNDMLEGKPSKQRSKTKQQKKRVRDKVSDDDMSKGRPSNKKNETTQRKKRALDEESNGNPLEIANGRRRSMRQSQKKRKVQITKEAPRIVEDTSRGRETRLAKKVKSLINRLLPTS